MWPISIRKNELVKTSDDLAQALSGVDDVRRQLDELRLTLREIQVDVRKAASMAPAPKSNGKVDIQR